MDGVTAPAATFVEISEVWVPDGDRLRLSGGNFGAQSDFEAVTRKESFAKGEGLPGRAWAEGKPVVLKAFDGSYFKRTEAAREAGLTSAVAVPVFAGADLKGVLVVLCGSDAGRTGAIEVWCEAAGRLTLDDGYYGAALDFERVSQRTEFPKGQGLPGSVWATRVPSLLRALGSGYGFLRAESAGKAGLKTGLGLPIPGPEGAISVLTLLSGQDTPIARRFEIWDARPAKVGHTGGAERIDGLCETAGPLWTDDTQEAPVRVSPWQGVVGRVLGTGIPVAETTTPATGHGYGSVVALPIFREDELAFVVAWYV